MFPTGALGEASRSRHRRSGSDVITAGCRRSTLMPPAWGSWARSCNLRSMATRSCSRASRPFAACFRALRSYKDAAESTATRPHTPRLLRRAARELHLVWPWIVDAPSIDCWRASSRWGAASRDDGHGRDILRLPPRFPASCQPNRRSSRRRSSSSRTPFWRLIVGAEAVERNGSWSVTKVLRVDRRGASWKDG